VLGVKGSQVQILSSRRCIRAGQRADPGFSGRPSRLSWTTWSRVSTWGGAACSRVAIRDCGPVGAILTQRAGRNRLLRDGHCIRWRLLHTRSLS
jgi:hypothetical protein